MDRYRVIKRIGTGTYGSAYLVSLVHDFNQQYVLKKIQLEAATEKEKKQAETEVKLLAQLDHPFVLGYIDHFTYKGQLCIVTDYCEGGDLQALLKTRTSPLPEPDILDYLAQTALALQHVHNRAVLHRDLKTQNIFLTQARTVQLGDFGIARPLDGTAELASTVIGTPYYMSPELMQSQPYDYKSDIWSLGCVVFEMMTLRHAFEATDMSTLVCKILQGDHVPIPTSYSQGLRGLVQQTLSRSPAERPSVDEVLELGFLQDAVSRAKQLVHDLREQRYAKMKSAISSGAKSGNRSSSSATCSPPVSPPTSPPGPSSSQQQELGLPAAAPAPTGPSWYHSATKAAAGSRRSLDVPLVHASPPAAGEPLAATESELDQQLQAAQQRLAEIEAARAALRQQQVHPEAPAVVASGRRSGLVSQSYSGPSCQGMAAAELAARPATSCVAAAASRPPLPGRAPPPRPPAAGPAADVRASVPLEAIQRLVREPSPEPSRAPHGGLPGRQQLMPPVADSLEQHLQQQQSRLASRGPSSRSLHVSPRAEPADAAAGGAMNSRGSSRLPSRASSRGNLAAPAPLPTLYSSAADDVIAASRPEASDVQGIRGSSRRRLGAPSAGQVDDYPLPIGQEASLAAAAAAGRSSISQLQRLSSRHADSAPVPGRQDHLPAHPAPAAAGHQRTSFTNLPAVSDSFSRRAQGAADSVPVAVGWAAAEPGGGAAGRRRRTQDHGEQHSGPGSGRGEGGAGMLPAPPVAKSSVLYSKRWSADGGPATISSQDVQAGGPSVASRLKYFQDKRAAEVRLMQQQQLQGM